jgi:hypothetical protein
MQCEHGEWYVGAGNMVCGRGCERRAGDIITEMQDTIARLRTIADEALTHRKKAEADGAATIAYEFVAHRRLDKMLSVLVEAGVCRNDGSR